MTIRLACWLLMVGLSLLFNPVVTSPSEPAREALHLLIQEYLATSDADKADAVLQQILSREEATVALVTSILHEGPTHGPAPVGAQPGQEVRVDSQLFRYGLYVPPDYGPEKAYGLVICLHGAGFSGDSYLERWQARLTDKYILACPTLTHGHWWTRTAEMLVMATIRTVSKQYHIDSDRIFLTGMSNGGIGAYLIGAHHAPCFAAVVPMASGLDKVLMPLLQNFRHTPLYIIHGKQDQVMPVQLSRSIVDILTELKYTFVYREHDREHPMAGGHFFPREELHELVSWLNQQHLDRYPKSLTVVEDATHLLRFAWARIDATDRIASFSESLIDQQDEAVKRRLYARIEGEIQDNRIEVQAQRVRRYTLFLNEQLVDLARPITVVTNGKISFEGALAPSVRTLLHEARIRQDFAALYSASITIDVPPDK